jgi:hypothetical protein
MQLRTYLAIPPVECVHSCRLGRCIGDVYFEGASLQLACVWASFIQLRVMRRLGGFGSKLNDEKSKELVPAES